MPLTFLIALMIAFGFDLGGGDGPMSRSEVARRSWEAGAGLLGISIVGMVLGLWVARRGTRPGGPTPTTKRIFYLGNRGVEYLTLAVFAWIIHWLKWPRVVEYGLGLRDYILIDECLIIAPFILGQFLGWCGLYPAERVLRMWKTGPSRRWGLRRYLILKARQSMGLVLPVAVVYALGRDLVRRGWPDADRNPYVLLAGMAFMGAFVLVFAPLFVRISWPTRRLPPGPLRDRLTCLSQRLRFRCTDILIWDTSGTLVNAAVTGALPWFRYVFLSDALVDGLEPNQIEAVFGHEVGHIAHRHLSYFGFFFVGSMGVMVLAQQGIRVLEGVSSGVKQLLESPSTWGIVLQSALAICCLALYCTFFGYLSRKFERQADVFGCRAVSCDRPECPPHADVNGGAVAVPRPEKLCPVGIRTFANALTTVATLNGMRHSAPSWRHGSISSRIRFLEGLDGRPQVERRFQRSVTFLRVVVAATLVVCLAIAIQTGALDQF
jgi:STE24 endopeptidase